MNLQPVQNCVIEKQENELNQTLAQKNHDTEVKVGHQVGRE